MNRHVNLSRDDSNTLPFYAPSPPVGIPRHRWKLSINPPATVESNRKFINRTFFFKRASSKNRSKHYRKREWLLPLRNIIM
jgi:hypothetical protein